MENFLLANGFICLLLIFIIVLKSGKRKYHIHKEVLRLHASSKNISDRRFFQRSTVDLPVPVRRYFFYVLKDRQRYISHVRLIHNGSFRLHQKLKWMKIRGEEYFTVENPGFLWYGKTPLFQAEDKYINGKGTLQVHLFSFLKLIKYEGKGINQGELFRWLAESVWFPTALLPSKHIRWEPLDEDSAKVILSHKGVSIEGIFYFNELGQIIRFEANRPKDKNLSSTENWSCYYSDYREINGIIIPFHGETVWNLSSGDFCYARFDLISVNYNTPRILKKYSLTTVKDLEKGEINNS